MGTDVIRHLKIILSNGPFNAAGARSACLAIFLISISIPTLALAAPNVHTFQTEACPIDHLDYQKALNDFRKFEAVVDKMNSKGESCHSVMETLTDLSSFYGKNTRTLLYKAGVFHSDEIVEKNLTIEELQKLNSYSEEMATRIARVVDLMVTRPSCFAEEKRPSFLGGMAALIGEVTTLASAYAGPEQIPLAIGAQLLSGVLFGLDRVMQEWDIYDIRKEAHRALYAQHLCAYDGVRKQVELLLRPSGAIEKLKKFEEKSQSKTTEIVSDCNECGDYDKNLKLSSTVDKMIANLSTLAVSETMTEQEKCLDLVDHVDSGGRLDLLFAEIDSHHNIANPGLERAEALIELIRKGNKVSTLDACVNLPTKLLAELNLATIGYVKKSLSWAIALTTPLIAKAQKDSKGKVFQWLAAKNEVNWAKGEIKKYEQYVNGSEFAKAELGRERECMDERLYRFTAPEFLEYYIKRAETRYKDYQSTLKATVDPLYRIRLNPNHYARESSRLASIPSLFQKLKSSGSKKDNFEFQSNLSHLENQLEQAINDHALVGRFCLYYRSHSLTRGSLANLCDPVAQKNREAGPLFSQASLKNQLNTLQ
jgi:hypothetical protein